MTFACHILADVYVGSLGKLALLKGELFPLGPTVKVPQLICVFNIFGSDAFSLTLFFFCYEVEAFIS